MSKRRQELLRELNKTARVVERLERQLMEARAAYKAARDAVIAELKSDSEYVKKEGES